ncbi:hypothetical protein UYA_23240 [Ectopseudomonas alcaliphila JAB1]|nr:hypothetical protein UYA_23240 [Pseudomonas alcaliphila JAB1]
MSTFGSIGFGLRARARGQLFQGLVEAFAQLVVDLRRAAATGQRQHYLVRQGALRQQVLSGESRTRSRLISTCCASRRPRT